MQPTRQEKDALIALFRGGRYAEACAAARAMAKRYPKALDAWNIRGAAARELGQLHEAEKCFRELERLAPAFAGAPYNLGLVYENKGAHEDAVAAYQRALTLDPDLAQAHNNLGGLYLRIGEFAASFRHLSRAVELQPASPEMQNSYGNLLHRIGRLDEARLAYERAIRAAPGFAKAHYNLGVLAGQCQDFAAGIAAHRAALAIDPGSSLARAGLMQQLAWVCDWPALEEHREHIAALGVEGEAVPVWPMLALEDAPGRQLVRARNWAMQRVTARRAPSSASAPVPARPRARPQRLKIGYFSADYHDHPGARLLRGLFRHHDRTRFEVHAFSYGPKSDDPYRCEAEAIVDRFHDVAGWPSARIVDLAHATGLDVALDRQGFTTDSRTELFQQRLAPVQIAYLGFPCTIAAPFIEYMIVDPVTAPPSHGVHFGERLIRLPHCYAPFDNTMPIDPRAPSRSQLGLPEDGLVLCCFNATYKITPREFDIWMRILRDAPGSVLWLFRSNNAVEANLRREATVRGVAGDRIVFADRLPNPAHLARHACADLFVDTFAMNAHTTTADALWAGLPVVTRIGEQFAARVAASLVTAAGLPECVTRSDAEYEALIRELARDRARLRALRAKLAEQRKTAPLFNTQLYTRHIEAGYEAAYDRFLKRRPPADIAVADLSAGGACP